MDPQLVELFRIVYTDKSTQGLISIEGVSKFTSLEPARGPELIPCGTYKVIKEMSPEFNRITPHLQDVPGHTYIEMHIGNTPADTLGCILIGDTKGVDWIGLSEVAFIAFMAMVPDVFFLTIHGSP